MAASPSLSASPSAAPHVGDVEGSVAPLSLPSLIAALRAGTPAQMADILAALDLGMPLWAERKGVPLEAEAAAAPVKPAKKSAGRPKKEPVPAAALPEAGEDGAPDAAAYRLDPSAVDHSVCVAREMNETDASKDKRWKPAVYRELQCGKSVAEGSDLCAGCAARLAKYAADPKPGKWTGRVTEEPLEWVHMLGTKWAVEKTPKWLGAAGGSAAASDASSDSGSAEEMPAAAPAPKGAIAASKKAEKAAEKEAAKAAKVAEKEAAAAAKKAEKEAAVAAKKAEKEAAASAKKAEKEAKKAEKPAKAKKAAPALAGGAAAAAVPAKADTAAAAEPAAGELKLIDGSLYMVRNGNVYEYNDLEETAGDFVGRLTADGEGIDADAEEVTAEESDSE
jgi:hypothetical protein